MRATLPSIPGDPASGVSALRVALAADFGGDVTWCYALPGATFAHAAGAVASTPPAWGLAPDDDGLVVVNLIPPGVGDPAPSLAALGLLPPGTAALPPFTTPPPPLRAADGSALPPVLGLEPLVGAFVCPASGRAWLLRRRSRRTLGDALRFGSSSSSTAQPGGAAPFFSPPAARLILFQIASAVDAAARAGLPAPSLTSDDILLGDGCARASVAPAALFRRPPPSALPAWAGGGVADATASWKDGSLSTLDYLLRLHVLAGRRWGDPRAHPFLPWVLRDLGSEAPHASAPSPAAAALRDLTRTQWRLVKGDAQLDASFEAAASPADAHHVPAPSPLGELGYCVALARSLPRSTLTARVRRGWVPGEYPASLARLAAWTADEAVPELYAGDGAAVFTSTHPDLPDLALPAWVPTPAAFLAAHRAALESNAVATGLPAWIDLTFGVALTGPAAIAAKNTAPPRQPGAGLPGVGRCQLFSQPHPARRPGVVPWWDTAGAETTSIPPWDDGLGGGGAGIAALGRLAVLIGAGHLLPLAPGDEGGWTAAAASLAGPEAAAFASACLAGQVEVSSDAFFTPATRAAAAALLQQADAEAAARAEGAGAGVAAAAGLAAAAGGRASALATASPEAWPLACPAFAAALGRAFAGAAHAGCSSTDTAGANAAAAALGLLLGRAPWGVVLADAVPTVGHLLAAGSAVVAAGGGGGQQQQPLTTGDDASPPPPRDRAPTMLAALLSRPCINAVLATGGAGPYLTHVHAHALDCLLLAGVKDGGGGGFTAGAAAEAMGEVAARLPLPATLEWVVRPLLCALGSGAATHAAAGLVAVGQAVGAAAVGRHLVPPLVSILASRLSRTNGTATAVTSSRPPPQLPSAGAVTALEGLVPLLTRAGAAALIAPRPAPADGRLSPARLVGPLLDPGAYAPLEAGVRVLLGKALVAAADVAAGGSSDAAGPSSSPFTRDLLPQLLALFRAPPAARAAFGNDDGETDAGKVPASPSTDLASRLAEAMAGGLGGAGNGASPPSSTPPSASSDSGWWRLAGSLYAAAVARMPAPALRTLVPGWVALEQGVPRVVHGWVQPALTPPAPGETALAGEVGRTADRLAGRAGGSIAPHRRATVEEGGLPPVAELVEEDAAARAAAFISGAGWSHPAAAAAAVEATAPERAGSRDEPPEAGAGRWAWLPPGMAPPPPTTSDQASAVTWGSPTTWAAGPPRSSAALLGLGPSTTTPTTTSDRLAPPPWAVQARPLHAWRAHRDRLRAVAVDNSECLVFTAGKAGPRRGGDASAPAKPPPGRDTARVWALADGRAGGEYSGHTSRITALAVTAGVAPAVASLDEGGSLHVWRSGDPTGGAAWVVGRPGEHQRQGVLVVEATGSPPPPAAVRAGQVPGYTCVVRAGDGGLGGTALVAGTADGRMGLVDAAAQVVPTTTRPGELWAGGGAVSALDAPPACSWTAAGSSGGHLAVVDGRCGPDTAVVAAWQAHTGGGPSAVTSILAAPPLLVTAGADRVLRVWDLRGCGGGSSAHTPPLLHAWAPLKAAPTSLTPVPGGGALAVAGPALAALPPLSPSSAFTPTLPTVRAAPHRVTVAGLALLPWSRLLVLGCDDGHVLVCK